MASLLDGPGQAKMAALEDALLRLQRLHGTVEKMGIAVRSKQETGSFRMQIQRIAAPLAALLKPQFGLVADLVTNLVLIGSRPGGEEMKLRALREGVAAIRMQLEISIAKVKEQHAAKPHEVSPAQD
jgi:hypothetical protein